MAADKTVSRPYAKAAFEEASTTGRLAEWSRGLAAAAAVAGDARVERLLGDPRVTPARLREFIVGIAGPELGEPERNFIAALAENHRLGYLREIAALFNELKDDAEGVADVTVSSAAPLDEAQRRALSEALARRLRRRIRLHCQIEPRLIGGAVVRAGDLVIDGSLRARLERMAYELTA